LLALALFFFVSFVERPATQGKNTGRTELTELTEQQMEVDFSSGY